MKKNSNLNLFSGFVSARVPQKPNPIRIRVLDPSLILKGSVYSIDDTYESINDELCGLIIPRKLAEELVSENRFYILEINIDNISEAANLSANAISLNSE